MENPRDSIEVLKNRKALSGALSRCERCGQRPPMPGRRWCRPCALKWQREHAGQSFAGAVEDFCPRWQDEIPPRYHGATLDDLPEGITEAFHALPDDRGLFLWGQPGRGKTHAMCALAKQFWHGGWDFRRITYERLSLDIRATFGSGNGESEQVVLEPLWTVPKLFIEDVGVTVSLGQQESDFSLRTLVTLLDIRLEWCRATFATSNKPIEAIAESFDGRVASRLCEACEIIEITGHDRRMRKDSIDV